MTTPKRAPDTNDTSATDDAGSSMSMPNESNNTPQLDSTQVPAAPVTLSDAYFSRSKTHRPTQSCGDSQAAAQHHTAPAASQPAVPDTTPQLGTRDYDDEDGLLPKYVVGFRCFVFTVCLPHAHVCYEYVFFFCAPKTFKLILCR